MKRLKAGNVVICEYVAMGSYSKHTLVNAYMGDITVKEFPATFPLAFLIELVPQEGLPNQIQIEIKQGKKVRAAIVAGFEFEKGRSIVLMLPQIPLTFTKNSEIQVVGSGDGLIPTVLARKRVSLGQISAG